MIPPVRRSSSAFRPPAPSFAAQSHFSAKALRFSQKGQKSPAQPQFFVEIGLLVLFWS